MTSMDENPILLPQRLTHWKNVVWPWLPLITGAGGKPGDHNTWLQMGHESRHDKESPLTFVSQSPRSYFFSISFFGFETRFSLVLFQYLEYLRWSFVRRSRDRLSFEKTAPKSIIVCWKTLFVFASALSLSSASQWSYILREVCLKYSLSHSLKRCILDVSFARLEL